MHSFYLLRHSQFNYKWNLDHFPVFGFEFHCLVIPQYLLENRTYLAIFLPWMAFFFRKTLACNVCCNSCWMLSRGLTMDWALSRQKASQLHFLKQQLTVRYIENACDAGTCSCSRGTADKFCTGTVLHACFMSHDFFFFLKKLTIMKNKKKFAQKSCETWHLFWIDTYCLNDHL